MIAALLLALSVPVQARTPQDPVARVMARVEQLVAAETGKDAREINNLDREAGRLSTELKPLGWKAVPALAAAAQDLKRPAKVRLLIVTLLALTEDPSALPPLEAVLLNPEQPPFVRALAAQSLPGLGAPAPAVRTALCAALARKNLPREVLSDVLIPLTRLGCEDPGPLARVARSFGPRPDKKDTPLVNAAITALGRSRSSASDRLLLTLVSDFPEQGTPRTAVMTALESRRAEIAAWLNPEGLSIVVEVLRDLEKERWQTLIPLIHLASALGPDAAPALERLTKHPDAEVLAETAEALAGLKYVEALPALDGIVARAPRDPRFVAEKNRPDPAASLARIQKAVEALRGALKPIR